MGCFIGKVSTLWNLVFWFGLRCNFGLFFFKSKPPTLSQINTIVSDISLWAFYIQITHLLKGLLLFFETFLMKNSHWILLSALFILISLKRVQCWRKTRGILLISWGELSYITIEGIQVKIKEILINTCRS